MCLLDKMWEKVEIILIKASKALKDIQTTNMVNQIRIIPLKVREAVLGHYLSKYQNYSRIAHFIWRSN